MTSRLRTLQRLALVSVLVGAPAASVAAQGNSQPAPPGEMVATYNTLADGILALKSTEENLVRSILSAAYAHGQVQLDRARKALAGNDAAGARGAIEALATDVAQLATEGDNTVAAVRKRLLQGG